MVNVHHSGAELSYTYVQIDHVQRFHKISLIRKLIFKLSATSNHGVSQYQLVVFHEYIADARHAHVLYSHVVHDNHAQLSDMSALISTDHM